MTLTVDGTPRSARPGELLVTVLRRHAIEVPTLCHDERLSPYGGCRLCVVARRDGPGGLVAACSTHVEPGMIIDTGAPEVIEARRRQLQLLVLDHRMECPTCDSSGECRLQDLVTTYGIPAERLPYEPFHAPRETTSMLIDRDPAKCVLCGKCFRLCDEVQGVEELGLVDRGRGVYVTTLEDRALDCEFCGQCVDACPVGALVARPFSAAVPAWMRDVSTTTCSFCSCGCQLEVETFEGEIQRVSGSNAASPNHGKLCVKGRFGWDLLRSEDRLAGPLVRRGGRLVAASWEEALATAVEGLRRASSKGKAVVGVGSARLTTEDAYTFQRLLRQVLGSPHVGPGPAPGMRALMRGVREIFGQPRSTATFEDLRSADTVFIVCADPGRTHPLVKTEVVSGVRQRGQRLILAHALSGGLGRHARPFVPLPPLGEETFLHGLAHLVLSTGRVDHGRCSGIPGFGQLRSDLAAYDSGTVARLLGLPEEQLRQVADAIAAAERLVGVVVTGSGIPGDEAAVARAMSHLLVLLGRDAGPGNGVMILGEKANLQGVIDAGMHQGSLPGWRRAVDPESADEFEARWNFGVPRGCGWGPWESMQRSLAGDVGAFYLVGQDPVGAWARGEGARAGLEGADFVVVQDAFLTETAVLADVVLPVALLMERSGTMISCDGVSRRLRSVSPPPPDTVADATVFRELARRLGTELPEEESLHRELSTLLAEAYARPATTAFVRVPAPPREPLTVRSMVLDAAPQLFHSGSVTSHSRILQELAPAVVLRVAREDAAKIQAENGELVRVASGGREVLLRVRIDPSVRAGTAMALWQSSGGGGSVLAPAGEDVALVEIRRS